MPFLGANFLNYFYLQKLLGDFYSKVKNKSISAQELDEIRDIVLEMFDSNKDGKLQINELAK